jgi:hypothetical protein
MNPYVGSTLRLSALRVFSLAIALAVPVTVFGQGEETPKPAVDLTPGTAHYVVRLEAGGRAVMMYVTKTTKSQGRTWIVTQTTRVGDRVQSDETTVEKKTLIIRRRLFHSGDNVADLQFAGHRVTGTVFDGEETKKVDADLGCVIFADGGGSEDVMAALPLAKGYTTEFRNFNVGSLQVKKLQLRVTDSETVTVPAGTFDTWMVLITSLDGMSDTYGLYVDKRTHRVVKMGLSIPNMGDALAIAELTK